MESGSQSHVSFEWIGAQNYLKEKVPSGGKRTRGANATSADAAVLIQSEDGTREIVLIEWKYTESYHSLSLRFARSGFDRSQTYRELLERDDSPIDMALVPDVADLFYEPFYQFMRQQLLAHEMEIAQELGASVVRLLHIAPATNRDFQRITSPALKDLGSTAVEVWKRVVRPADRFQSISTESLFGRFPVRAYPGLQPWWDYLHERYAWLNSDEDP
jgi:hypothetical protein